ncbi:MAG TPA: NAD(P)-dependent alcohol dehydrogenase [Phycicoccus sp.]|nr:NAD(P)-dependent alcohol dehydrogenase [Phycicoccus sp.]
MKKTYDVREKVVRAVVQDRYGLDALRVDEVTAPVPGSGEVLVRVEAAGVDRGTWHLATGLPYLARLGIGLRRPRYRIPGRDVAGTVEAVGPRVTGFAPGDPVFGTADGSFAELAVVPVRRLAPRPATLTAVESAAVPVSALTAYQAVRMAGVGPGQRVLVVGASGGVGTYAVQMAIAAGARVTGVCSPGKADLVRSLGAAHVIDHTREAVDAEGVRYDIVLDIGGNRRLRELRRVLTERGTLVVIGGEDGGRLTGGIQRGIAAVLLSMFVRHRLVMHYSREVATDLERVTALIEAGDVRPVVERVWRLDEAAAAIEHVGAGRARGKSVIDVAGRDARR